MTPEEESKLQQAFAALREHQVPHIASCFLKFVEEGVSASHASSLALGMCGYFPSEPSTLKDELEALKLLVESLQERIIRLEEKE